MDETGSPQPAEAAPLTEAPPPETQRPVGQQPQGLVAAAGDGAKAIVGQVKEQLAGKATAQKDSVADGIDQLADSVHRTGEQFAGKQDWLARAIDSGAGELSSLATALRQNDLGSLMAQVQSFARRQPGVFVGASLAAGFALARVGRIVAADLSRDDLPTMPELHHADQ